LKNIAKIICLSSESIIEIGRETQQYEVRPKDALHIACAIKTNCDYFITTDSKLLNKQIPNIKITNPINFVSKLEE
jgi:predicted nucleic acid-binding protein